VSDSPVSGRSELKRFEPSVPFRDVHAGPRLSATSATRRSWPDTCSPVSVTVGTTPAKSLLVRGRSAAAVADQDRWLLVYAAWLHDIGYSPEVSRTGFHPLDGARYLLSVGASADLVGAVAHHSCARF